MEVLVIAIFAMVFPLIKIFMKLSESRAENSREVEQTQEALCDTCTCSLIRNGSDGNKFVYCNYGGGMNLVNFVVLECSGYRNCTVEKPAKVAGFIKPGHRLPPNVTVIRVAAKTGTN